MLRQSSPLLVSFILRRVGAKLEQCFEIIYTVSIIIMRHGMLLLSLTSGCLLASCEQACREEQPLQSASVDLTVKLRKIRI